MSRPASADSPADDRYQDELSVRRALSRRDGEPVALSLVPRSPRRTAVQGLYRAARGPL